MFAGCRAGSGLRPGVRGRAWLWGRPRCRCVPLLVGIVPAGAGGQVPAVVGGPHAWKNSSVQALAQGQPAGRCRCSRRAEVAIRAGTAMSLRRMVAVAALARAGPVIVAAAWVRLNAMTAQTNQAALAVGYWRR